MPPSSHPVPSPQRRIALPSRPSSSDAPFPVDRATLARIEGNASDDTKAFTYSSFKHHLGKPDQGWFSTAIGHRARLVRVDVWLHGGQKANETEAHEISGHTGGLAGGHGLETAAGSGGKFKDTAEEPARAETIFEITVTRDMCNLFGTMHGACAGFLVDHCSVSPLIALGHALGVDGTGLTQSMNLTWGDGAAIGTTLRIHSTSMVIRGRMRMARCDIWKVPTPVSGRYSTDGERGAGSELLLCVSGVHTLVNAPKKMIPADGPPSSSIGSPAAHFVPAQSPSGSTANLAMGFGSEGAYDASPCSRGHVASERAKL